jgi:hypothetical protein
MARGATLAPRAISVLRFVALVVIVASLVLLTVLRRRANAELEQGRAALLADVRSQRAALPPGYAGRMASVASVLMHEAGPYASDVASSGPISPEDSIYVRGDLAVFTSTTGIATVAATSRKDAFVACLVVPPEDKAEKSLMEKVRALSRRDRASTDRLASVHRLYDAQVGLSYLSDEWEGRVQNAADTRAVEGLRSDFAHAPIAEAKKAAGARWLVYLMDEPNEPGGITELDGEHAHAVRVGVVDLTTKSVVLRQRRRVDPSFISLPRRAEYSRSLDSCALAYDVGRGD